MLKFTPILLAILYGLVMYQFSAWRLKQSLNQQSTRLHDPRFKSVLDRMAAALGVADIKVYIHEVEPINGLAAPDGRIFITRGFMNKLNEGSVTVDELASVIAHELGHVALGHSRRRMIDFSGQNAMRVALGMVLSRFIPGIGAWIANMIGSLLMAKLSRSDEFEADEYASALMIKAGIGVDAQISLFENLDKLTGSRGATPAWMMSHPKTEDRIAAIRKNQLAWS